MRYNALMSQGSFLRIRQRALRLGYAVNLLSINYTDNEFQFLTKSQTTPGVVWTQRIQLQKKITPEEVARMDSRELQMRILDGQLKIYCNCIAEGTLIFTKEGFKEIQNVHKGDFVMGGDGKWHIVAELLESTEKKEWVSIKLRGELHPLIISTDHKVLVSTYRDFCRCGCGKSLRPMSESQKKINALNLFNRHSVIPKHCKRPIGDNFERHQLKKVSEIRAGELLCSPIIKTGHVIQFDADYARMLGYYLAEGCLAHKRGTMVKLTVSIDEKDTIGQDVFSYFSDKGIRVELKEYHVDSRKWMDIQVYSKQFREDCKKYCGIYSKTKRLHSDIYDWDDESKKSFIVGYFLGDGCSSGNKIRFSSISLDIINGVKVLLNSLKISSSSYKGNPAFHSYSKNAVYTLSVPFNQFYTLYEQYAPLFKHKAPIKKNKSYGQSNYIGDSYIYRTISSIEPVEYNGKSYDICLFDEPHTYVANNIIVSNCPAYTFWGFAYKAWMRGYGLVRETRRPIVRNPKEQGWCCKHLYAIMNAWKFYAPMIADQYKTWYDRNTK